jgi:hypothetical protein
VDEAENLSHLQRTPASVRLRTKESSSKQHRGWRGQLRPLGEFEEATNAAQAVRADLIDELPSAFHSSFRSKMKWMDEQQAQPPPRLACGRASARAICSD